MAATAPRPHNPPESARTRADEATLAPERGPDAGQVGPDAQSPPEEEISEDQSGEDSDSTEGQVLEPKSIGSDSPSTTHPFASQAQDGEVIEDKLNNNAKTSAPPLPDEAPPPLPQEPLPSTNASEDDGWEPVWDEAAQAFYFYNRISGQTQWDNPRVPGTAVSSDAITTSIAAPGTTPSDHDQKPPPTLRPHGGYDPSIHGDYDPTAPYAIEAQQAAAAAQSSGTAAVDPSAAYAATGTFNRFTGRWQAADRNPENHSDEAKSKRQMNAFFDVDAAANNHAGKSLKAERSGLKLSKQELKAFKEKRREKKEEKRRAWLRD